MADKKPPEADPKGMSDQERFNKQVEAAQKARAAQATAKSWKEKAMKCMDAKERRKMLQNAYDHEVEAHGHSKYAKRLQSGTWQGGAAGLGIGAGVGAGLGTVVGTLVGGIASIPTAALGTLTGIAVGGIHGPFFHLDDHKKSNEQLNEEVMDEAKKLDAAVEEGAKEPVPPKFDDDEGGSTMEKRRPKKLDNRSSSQVDVTADVPKERKKPRKIEVRSKAAEQQTAA